MRKLSGSVALTIGDMEMALEYEYDPQDYSWYEIENVWVLVGEGPAAAKYWRLVDWENEMYDPQFAHISTERLEKAIALDIAKNVA